jgi:hypothetical protein
MKACGSCVGLKTAFKKSRPLHHDTHYITNMNNRHGTYDIAENQRAGSTCRTQTAGLPLHALRLNLASTAISLSTTFFMAKGSNFPVPFSSIICENAKFAMTPTFRQRQCGASITKGVVTSLGLPDTRPLFASKSHIFQSNMDDQLQRKRI